MPWKESSAMSQRLEFVRLATQESANIRQLCRRFEVSHTSAYKWLSRYRDAAAAAATDSPALQEALLDRSRRPLNSPRRTPVEVERAIIEVRTAHPSWGGRKIRARLIDLGHDEQRLPQPSTITSILSRHQLIDEEESNKRHQLIRFEHPHPNDLWQMDFKGEFALDTSSSSARGSFCYPLTVLDDHSRFALALTACPSQSTKSTQKALTEVFRRYGLPERMTMDNGSPWGTPRGARCYTHFAVWLMRLGISVTHSRPHHPQTQGKDERFHRTLEAELLRPNRRDDLTSTRQNNRHRRPYPRLSPENTIEAWQKQFDLWRVIYNCQRPHEALGMQVPAQRYQPSPRSFPEVLPAVEYDSSDIVRKVQRRGLISYHKKHYFIGSAFYGLNVALRYTLSDGVMEVFFCDQKVGQIRLR
jgi:transposase InsO family protein